MELGRQKMNKSRIHDNTAILEDADLVIIDASWYLRHKIYSQEVADSNRM